MKNFNVVVNGVSYDVAVTELKAGEVVTPVAAAKAAAPAAAPVASGSGTEVTAPMPGNLWKVMVKQGQAVKKGDVLVILEALKMENEIFAPCDGVVASMNVAEGAAVDTDQVICVIS